MTDFNSFRGNVFNKKKLDIDGVVDIKDSLGRLQYIPVTGRKKTQPEEIIKNRITKDLLMKNSTTKKGDQRCQYGVTTLVNNQARVFKGGSWNDRAYWLSPEPKY